jgi:hypothetical protein
MAKQDSWKLDGTCSTHPERYTLWHPTFETPPDEIQRAKELCESCPVRVQCKLKGKGEKFGIWGATLMGLDPGDFLE